MIESASGGSANVMAALALHGVDRGHEVHVVYSGDRADEELIDRLRQGGCASIRQSRMRRQITARDLADGLLLRRTLGGIGPLDVIHSHSSKAGALARTLGRARGAAQVYSPHGFYTMTPEAPFYIGTVERALSLVTDRIIAVSEYEKRHGIGLGIASGKIDVIPNGLAPYRPLSREAARAELGVAADARVVGFVGRLVPQKDPVAAVNIMKSMDVATLAIIGDGPLRPVAEQAARTGNGNILFAGARDARMLMPAFDLLLCTSGYEGMPVAFLEALHCGVPIVSFPVGGTDELVREGETGMVAGPGDAADAVSYLLGLPKSEMDRMRASCRKLAGTFSADRMGDSTLDLYRTLLDRRPGQP